MISYDDIDNKIRKQDRINRVKEGIDFIFLHFENMQQQFPRTISTAYSNTKQFTVYNKKQVLNECVKANFIDCRINAYPVLDNNTINNGSNIQAPNFVFIDLDLDNKLSYKEAKIKLEKSKKKSINIIKERLADDDDGDVSSNCYHQPTILWTGNGYHIYIAIDIRPLELFRELKELSLRPSEEFLRFAELTFSNDKKDSGHHPSFRSCLLRIPYTFNSKNLVRNNKEDHVACENAEVKIIQNFDKHSKKTKY